MRNNSGRDDFTVISVLTTEPGIVLVPLYFTIFLLSVVGNTLVILTVAT